MFAKKIIIGKQGARIRDIGTKARHDIENLLGNQVFLKLFVKVVRDWHNREHKLYEIGIRENKNERETPVDNYFR